MTVISTRKKTPRSSPITPCTPGFKPTVCQKCFPPVIFHHDLLHPLVNDRHHFLSISVLFFGFLSSFCLFLLFREVEQAAFHRRLNASRTASTPLIVSYRFAAKPTRLYTVVVLLTFILIIISIPSPLTLSFQILKPSFFANPSHRSLPFLLQD